MFEHRKGISEPAFRGVVWINDHCVIPVNRASSFYLHDHLQKIKEWNPSMINSQSSRLTCECCHGIGYVSTALGKLPCPACSAAEVSTGQESSEVSNHMESSDE